MIARLGPSLVVMAALGSTTGCSLLLDTIYLAGDRTFRTTEEQRTPTGERQEGIEYAARVVDGGLELSCARVSRGIDRRSTVSRKFQRRGGFERSAYLGTAFVSGFFGAITAGVLLGVCLGKDHEVSCAWTAASAPLFADLGYGLIRGAMAEPPKLIARERSADSIALGSVGERAPIACDGLRDVALGRVSGASPEQALGTDAAEPQRLVESGARHFPLAGTHATLTLTLADAERWATDAQLWAIDADGIAHAVQVDRCASLRPFALGMSQPVRQRFDADCPLPAATVVAPGTPLVTPASSPGPQPPAGPSTAR